MKKLVSILIFSISASIASPAVMGGITFNFGASDSKDSLSGAGLTAKILSTSEDKKPVVGAGVSYFPWAKDKKLGLDLSAGYNFKNSSVMAGWDFLKNEPSVSLGYSKEVTTNSDTNQFVDGIQDARCDKSK